MLVKGVTADLYRALQTKITVEGPGTVNINTASKEILEALGASPALVGKFLICRKGADGLEGTADDIVFSKIKSVPEQLEKRWPLTESDRLSWQSVERLMTVKGNALRVNGPITLDDSQSSRWCEIVLTPSDPRAIRSYHEGSGWGEK